MHDVTLFCIGLALGGYGIYSSVETIINSG